MSTSCSILGVIPGRSEPSHKSEMISQLLFGEEFEIIEKNKEWVFIKSLRDNYDFWIEEKQCRLSFTKKKKLSPYNFKCSKNLVSSIKLQNQFIQNLIIPIGSILPLDNFGNFEINGEKYLFTDPTHSPQLNRDELIYFANKFINTPYLWGGKTPFGIDCSGFIQICFRMVGIELPRDAYLQVNIGTPINLTEAKPGDLAFFENSNGRITHVGIILKDNQIIHASGHVKIEQLDEKGIYSTQLQSYTHNLHSIKKIL